MTVKGPNNQMRGRIGALTLLFVGLGFGLVGLRLFYMQVLRHDFYMQEAVTLQTRDAIVAPNRGTIYDANMQVLAESATVQRVTVNPKGVIDEAKVKKGITAEMQQQKLAEVLISMLTTPTAHRSYLTKNLPSYRRATC